jgi:hypothetical protein
MRDLGVRSVRLMTNNPDKAAALEAQGLPVSERIGLERRPTQENAEYLRTKRDRMGHRLTRVRHLELAGEAHAEHDRSEPRPERSDEHAWMPGVEMAV